MKPYIVLGLVPLALLGACATVPPTPSQVAACEEMERDMGLSTPHDHGEMKQQGRNPMNLSHDRCQQILKQR
ncbi:MULTISPECIES: hypothetical protein [unclassified Sphingobium]|uniref:hypothetical protein n=1 Tax=unclassified Sphingobium TaxID=2611147 RepID=UPI00044D0FE3|nr:hypothetical protein [Sphingobium sp. Ant17]EXS68705.1 hypothetical protein BF95_00540 [Sphingobium sp. Ant17]